MNWIILILAGLAETLFTFCLAKAKEASGYEVYVWYTCFAIAITVSMGLLLKALQTLPIGTAYAVWTGIGAVGTAIIGILFFKEPTNLWRMFFMMTLIGSIIGLKFSSH